ncbi:hypothetical protein SHELI_v1c11390 [Spiroplasma helicoides]|uniref:Lipolytic enzyme, GDSL family n=1 Tax=Spiroplasma helicoides TaxID=216938 RepID=A0A1B3SMD2_9MOLU|nr:SGNH/GDSL hydrolase family protein [Spiroplasma helicoides]AOG61086.1 hypothetical protein SHELI_v1c11390 [Spiroplasma helicoides]
MKKLLSVLSSFLIVINGSAISVACNKSDEPTQNDTENDGSTAKNKIEKFENFYTMGDSLSDAGGYKNIAKAIINKKKNPPKEFQNFENFDYDFGGSFKTDFMDNKYPSYTNGRTAAEWVNQYLGFTTPMKPGGAWLEDSSDGVGRNYAVGGARASFDITFNFREAGIKNEYMKVDIISQSEALTKQHKLTNKDIVFVEIGGNDFLEGMQQFQDGLSIPKFQKVADDAASNLQIALNNILKTGANVLYMNSPDMRYIPTLLKGQLKEDGTKDTLSVMVESMPSLIDTVHNQLDSYLYDETYKVYTDLKKKYKDQIFIYDLFKNFKDLKDDYSKVYKEKFNKDLNVTNNFGVDTVRNRTATNVLVQANNAVKGHNAEDIDSFFFIDEVHPTRYVHQYVGKLLYNYMEHIWIKDSKPKELTLDDIK